jgi:biotin carboxylase
LTKTLLVLGAGVQAVEGLRQLAEQGWRIIGCDADAEAPGFVHCDDRIIASVYHAEECVPAAERYHKTINSIDGVMCLAVDTPHVVARIAEQLALPGLPVEIADLAVDKVAMKSRLMQHGVPTPRFQAIFSIIELEAFANECPHGVVVKPIDSRGSKGVSWVREREGLASAFNHAREWSPSNRIMVEEFTRGPQLSTESIIADGVAHTIGISDRNYEFLETYAPHIVENGGDLPSTLSDTEVDSARDIIQAVANAFGMKNGIIKGDIVIHENRAQVIEVALRLSGGYFCTYEIPLNTGASTVIPTAKLALGLPVTAEELAPKYQRHVIQRYIFPSPGHVQSVMGVSEAASLAGVAYTEVWSKPGDRISKPENASGSAGVVMTCADTRDEALAAMLRAMETIKVETVPDDG